MEEVKYSFNALVSPPDIRDYKAKYLIVSEINIPETYDLRKYLLPIRDQGVEGSCVSEACMAIKEYQEYKNVGFNDYFSVQFFYNNRQPQNVEGMIIRNALNDLRKNGVIPEEEYPYGKIESSEVLNLHTEFFEQAKNYLVSSYVSIDTIEELKKSILLNGPCMIVVPVYNQNNNMWIGSGNTIGNHAMAVVGWDKNGFIVRNSWGEEWGDKGYTNFPYSDWGKQNEVWTIVDDLTTKSDKKYTTLRYKILRYAKHIFVDNFKNTFFFDIAIVSSFIYGCFNPVVFAGCFVFVGLLLFLSWKNLGL